MKTISAIVVSVVLGATALATHELNRSVGLDKAQKSETVEALAKALEEKYIFEELGRKAAAQIRANLKAGKYDAAEEGTAFAKELQSNVQAILNDAHFHISYFDKPLPKVTQAGEPTPDQIAKQQDFTRRMNGGFQKVEHLPGNVGYLKFNMFVDLHDAKRAAESAMAFLAETDALIFDLRDNGGGDPETVQFICSYLFDEKPVHLNSLIWRDGRKQEFWTLKDLPGKRYLDKPVYVLTSKRTGSAAEEFSYNLQQLKRATIVGEVTWGGANPGGLVRLSDHFRSFVPNGRAENPYTKDNWEGKGVKPDVAIDPAKALNRAHELAVEEMLKTANDERKSQLEKLLARLKSESGQ